MKKLKLNLDGIAHPLSIAQMKKIYGGTQSCTIYCCTTSNDSSFGAYSSGDSCPTQSDGDAICQSHSNNSVYTQECRTSPGCGCDVY